MLRLRGIEIRLHACAGRQKKKPKLQRRKQTNRTPFGAHSRKRSFSKRRLGRKRRSATFSKLARSRSRCARAASSWDESFCTASPPSDAAAALAVSAPLWQRERPSRGGAEVPSAQGRADGRRKDGGGGAVPRAKRGDGKQALRRSFATRGCREGRKGAYVFSRCSSSCSSATWKSGRSHHPHYWSHRQHHTANSKLRPKQNSGDVGEVKL